MSIDFEKLTIKWEELNSLGDVKISFPVKGERGYSGNYNELENKPRINNIQLIGNKTLSDLGIASTSDLSDVSSQVDSNTSRISDLESAESNLEITVTNIDGRVTSNTNRITIAENRISQIPRPTDAQVKNAVDSWLDTHPEATTTVEDGAISFPKLADDVASLAIVEPASGDIASFNDGADGVAMKELNVAINPIQDLNGYTHPWAGGGGVNKLPNALAGTNSNNGVTMVSNGDGSYTLSGATTTSGANIYFDLVDEYEIASGDYLYIWNSVANASTSLNLEKAGGGNINYYGIAPANRIVQIADTYVGQSIGRIRVYVASNTTISMTIKPMIAKSNSLTAFEPYSNICPISGWDSVDVNVSGINVWDEEWENGYFSLSGNPSPSNTAIRSKNFCPCIGGQTYYYFFGGSVGTTYILWYDQNQTLIGQRVGVANATATAPSNAVYFKICTNTSYGTTYNNDISINYPSTDTAYHPYNGNTTTVDLGQTVYGGSLNVTTGVLTIDKVRINLTSSLNWILISNNRVYFVLPNAPKHSVTWFAISNAMTYNTGSTTDPWTFYLNSTPSLVVYMPSSITTVADWKTYLDNNEIYVVYELATPTTVQLTAQQVNTLLGQNNVFADSGDVEVIYRADTKTYIDNKFTELTNAIISLGGNV